MDIPDNAVIRVNLAWARDINYLRGELFEGLKNDIFLDLPIGRKKPPNTKFDISELKELIKEFDRVKYFAISNIESKKDLIPYLDAFSREVNIIPKIESKKGIINIEEIISVLGENKMVMLDHDDLYADLIRCGVPSSSFFDYITRLSKFCDDNSVNLLKTRGVIFSDKDQYYY